MGGRLSCLVHCHIYFGCSGKHKQSFYYFRWFIWMSAVAKSFLKSLKAYPRK
uniref:Uncharacterized protein n=1 Tax=Rhizophora mucronata TaxID=61149 RepID=A0A2P2N4E5_RHIMU